MKGVVCKSTGSHYLVKTESGAIFQCRIKGIFRLKESKNTNPVTVGDHVIIKLENENQAIIAEILPRENYIIRKSTNLSKQTHIIASNISQSMLVATLHSPRTSTGFIDRFLVTSEAYHIKPIIVFNKIDLYESEDLAQLEFLTAIYHMAGYTCVHTSTETGGGIEKLKSLLANENTLISGHSGVGKSTLVNKIDPLLNLRIGEISHYHQKGMHTTTFAEMHFLTFGGSIIDTPGIKEFGLVDFDKYEISRFFPEMMPYISQCKFNTCLHEEEPGCAIRKAYDEGFISSSRYQNYLNMLHSEEVNKKHYQ
jgi:ribosome biogenesis GTPase